MKGFQGSFTGGELDPALSGRVDLAKYAVGCKKLENFIVQPHGGAYRRPGLPFVVKALGITRLIDFQYNVEQAYVLAFSDLKMRVIKDGGVVLDSTASKTITAATEASPCQVTATIHGLLTGDNVYISGVGGMVELNDRFFTVTKIDADNVTLDGVDSTGYTTFTSGGTLAKIYTETTPYVEADLNGLYVAQSADTMYICHSGYAPRKLTRSDHDDWAFTTVALATSVTAPSGSSATWAGGLNIGSAKDIADATNTNPVKIRTSNNHGFETGDTVYISGVEGMVELNVNDYTITIVDLDEFTLDGIDGTGYTPYTYGGTAQEQGGYLIKYKVVTVSADTEESLPSSVFNVVGKHQADWVAGNFIAITIGAVGGAMQYDVYKERNGLYGYIGSTPTTAFRDDNYTPDLLYVPQEANDPFSGGANYYPSSVSFFKQRIWYGGSNKFPQTTWASQPGLFDNFNKSRPLRDTDSLEFTLAATKVNTIRWMMPFGDLLIGTSGSEWLIFSSGDGAITPSTTDTKVQSYWGSAAVAPIIIGDSVVHVQHQGSKIRDLFYSLEKDSYAGNDLTIMAGHLFQGKSIVSWAYQRSPDSVLWCVMSDGSLNGLTYHKEHQVWGWHKHVTDGTFESVAVIPGDLYDDVYFVVNRTIQSATVRYIEKLSNKWLLTDGIASAMFLDSALSYNGFPATVFSGLDHLEGETISVLADGSPVEGLVVTDGAIELESEASVVHAGLPMTATLAPMGVEVLGGETGSVGRIKSIAKVIVRFAATVGGRIGPTETRNDPLKFKPAKYGEAIIPVDILDYEFTPPGSYSRDGSFFIIQEQPLPMTILAIMPDFITGSL